VIDCSCMPLHDTDAYNKFKFIVIVLRVACGCLYCKMSLWHCNRRWVTIADAEGMNKIILKYT
jgi:hypothetical protein